MQEPCSTYPTYPLVPKQQAEEEKKKKTWGGGNQLTWVCMERIIEMELVVVVVTLMNT